MRSKVLPQAKSKCKAIPLHPYHILLVPITSNCCAYCFAVLTAGSVAWLTISVPRKKYLVQSNCKPSNTSNKRIRTQGTPYVTVTVHPTDGSRSTRIFCFLLFACGRTLLRTCSASLATSELKVEVSIAIVTHPDPMHRTQQGTLAWA